MHQLRQILRYLRCYHERVTVEPTPPFWSLIASFSLKLLGKNVYDAGTGGEFPLLPFAKINAVSSSSKLGDPNRFCTMTLSQNKHFLFSGFRKTGVRSRRVAVCDRQLLPSLSSVSGCFWVLSKSRC